jgi:hypothetical protein
MAKAMRFSLESDEMPLTNINAKNASKIPGETNQTRVPFAQSTHLDGFGT